MMRRIAWLCLLTLPLFGGGAWAGVLPDDRTDVMYHLYEGGGVRIDGPSLLVRKKVGKSVSFVSNYYVDMVSSASIDVVTTASPYTEERTQWSLGMDYLRGNTMMTANFTSSVESDFDAKTYSFGVSQDMFGDLTTLSLSYSYGEDVVGRSDDPDFARDNRRQQYAVGLTQILTRNLITSLNYETITDEGFLNNPYRSVRYADPNSSLGYSYEPELYPRTRTTNAIGIRARYFLPWRAAIEGEYRAFTDTWGITSNTGALTYVHPWKDWTFEVKYRLHDQTGADFFSDLFSRSEATNFRARDKELSALTSTTFKLMATWEFMSDGWAFIDRGSVTFSYDHLMIDYEEFRDLRTGALVGEEPLFALDANVIQVFFSFWY
ncbi:MAG: DUF3570 domain-containing protein [Pseudomonadota bacterium]